MPRGSISRGINGRDDASRERRPVASVEGSLSPLAGVVIALYVRPWSGTVMLGLGEREPRVKKNTLRRDRLT